MPARVAIGVMAYNEELNIARLLESILGQTAIDRIDRIVVVASGCTDATCQIVRQFAQEHSRISLIEESARAGKIAAVNRFMLSSSEDILVLSGADLVWDPNAIAALLEPFEDPEVGMVGAHSVPLDSDKTFFGYAANLMWALHDRVSLVDPKMGELVAYRNVFHRINPGVTTDELMVHQIVRSLGYKVVYASHAIVRNKGPENLREFISQRMHCIVGNYELMRDHHVPASTMRTLPVLRAAAPLILTNWRRGHWTAAVAALEAWCRVRGKLALRAKKGSAYNKLWDQLTTSKLLAPAPKGKAAH